VRSEETQDGAIAVRCNSCWLVLFLFVADGHKNDIDIWAWLHYWYTWRVEVLWCMRRHCVRVDI